MKSLERDDLLIRVDERTMNIENLTEKQERHLSMINGKLVEQGKNITASQAAIQANEKSIGLLWKILLGLGSAVALSVIGIGIARLFGS